MFMPMPWTQSYSDDLYPKVVEDVFKASMARCKRFFDLFFNKQEVRFTGLVIQSPVIAQPPAHNEVGLP